MPGKPELDATLLAIFAAPEADHGERLATLAVDDWQVLFDRAQAQRGETLLRAALRRARERAIAPPAIATALDDALRSRTFTALRQAEALRRVLRILAEENLTPIALKGVRLAWQTYPAPALRPMRDLDLLLSPNAVERARSILLARADYDHPEWAGRYGVEYGHQLPEIVDRDTGVTIELHHRLNARGWAEEGRLIDLMTRTSETLPLGGGAVRVPSAHANLLHLVEHATLHHLFDNGPVVLADVHFIAANEPIDWPLLVSQAREMGLGRALALLAALAARHGADWPDIAGVGDDALVDPEQLHAAEVAMLRNPEDRDEVAFLRRLETRTGAAPGITAGIRAALAPGARSLAELAGTSPRDPRRWLAYPLWLARRAARYRGTRDARASGESSRQARLLDWLRG